MTADAAWGPRAAARRLPIAEHAPPRAAHASLAAVACERRGTVPAGDVGNVQDGCGAVTDIAGSENKEESWRRDGPVLALGARRTCDL